MKLSKKVLKITGIVVGIAGCLITLATKCLDDAKLKEDIKDEVEKQLKERDS